MCHYACLIAMNWTDGPELNLPLGFTLCLPLAVYLSWYCFIITTLRSWASVETLKFLKCWCKTVNWESNSPEWWLRGGRVLETYSETITIFAVVFSASRSILLLFCFLAICNFVEWCVFSHFISLRTHTNTSTNSVTRRLTHQNDGLLECTDLSPLDASFTLPLSLQPFIPPFPPM